MIEDETGRLRELISIGIDSSRIRDFDLLMERILQSARDFVRCDAGSLYIKQEDRLLFSYTQNDTLSARLEPGRKLVYNTFSIPVNKNSLAGYAAMTGETLNISDAYDLPGALPFQIDKQYDRISGYRTSSILTVPLKTHTEKIIGVLQLINAMDKDRQVIPFDQAIEPYVNYIASQAAAALERAHLIRTIILRMISMAELRDPKETGNHVNRVAGYSVEIYENWAGKRGISAGETERNRDVLRMAAMLHDVGKVAISDLILKKPARLDVDEYEIMKQHTVAGAKLFNEPASDLDEAARDVALNHHECFDGTGYPGHVDIATGEPLPGHADSEGRPAPKCGEEIPLFGRIVAIADVYDALSSVRVYKEAWDESRVLDEMRNGSGRHFDPEIIEAFFSALPSIKTVAGRYE